MYRVHQHWDPLRTCVVGRSYPPEFYSWIKVPHVRDLFEKIAIETEEDFCNIISKLESFGVEVLRPDLPEVSFDGTKFVKPPMTPRDTMVMIGKEFYSNYQTCDFIPYRKSYDQIFTKIRQQGNKVIDLFDSRCNGAAVSRIGKDLYFGTAEKGQDLELFHQKVQKEFSNHRTHVIDTAGHSDGTYCPVCPGLIISLHDVPTYQDTFPGWEVIYLPAQSWDRVAPFLHLKSRNNGRWWIPGFEYDSRVVSTVETWLDHWVGYVEETVFDINMLIIDPKNVMVFNENNQVFRALDRYGITPHVVPFRHRYFWDGGIHCVTLDLDRDGEMQDFFPSRQC